MKKPVEENSSPALREFMSRMSPCPASAPDEEPGLTGAMMCQIMMLNSVIERTGNRLLEEHALTLPQWLALGCISHAGEEGIPHSQIGQKLMLSKAPITGIVDRLERVGLVERRADLKDRRVSRAVATEKGVATWWNVKHTLRGHSENAINAALSDDEQETLLRLMGRLLDAFSHSDPTLADLHSKEVPAPIPTAKS
ncbi:MAG TPA: MarR family transcriptional regulator [Abditibacterium sp.]|jgi:MarR family 2-MHQ and catechol resistance regulon transcriptional repressor